MFLARFNCLTGSCNFADWYSSTRWRWSACIQTLFSRDNRTVTYRKGWCFAWKVVEQIRGTCDFFADSRRTESIRWIFSGPLRCTTCARIIQNENIVKNVDDCYENSLYSELWNAKKKNKNKYLKTCKIHLLGNRRPLNTALTLVLIYTHIPFECVIRCTWYLILSLYYIRALCKYVKRDRKKRKKFIDLVFPFSYGDLIITSRNGSSSYLGHIMMPRARIHNCVTRMTHQDGIFNVTSYGRWRSAGFNSSIGPCAVS